MPFFKRVEVWVLLVLTIGIVVAVLRMEQSDDVADDNGDAGAKTSDPAGKENQQGDSNNGEKSASRHQIAALQIERDGDYAVVEIRLTSAQDTTETKNARLLRSDGSEVAEFFVPSAATSATADGVRELLFWADRSTLAGELFLEIGGERLKVKDADDFKLDEVADGARKIIVGQALRLPPLDGLVQCGKRSACPAIASSTSLNCS